MDDWALGALSKPAPRGLITLECTLQGPHGPDVYQTLAQNPKPQPYMPKSFLIWQSRWMIGPLVP